MKHRLPTILRRVSIGIPLVASLLQVSGLAQDRLRTMPGYERYVKMTRAMPGAVKLGSVGVTWSADGRSFDYSNAGRRYRFDVASRAATEVGVAEPSQSRGGRGAGPGAQVAPERGRQFDTADSPDGRMTAVYRERNLWLRDAAGAEVRITSDGSETGRIKYGTASWVYGEELAQQTAMWWSPDNRRLAYYRFDEKQVPDYHLQVDQTRIQSRNEVEAYPKAGAPNPVVELYVYDVASKKSTRVDVRRGKPFDNAVVGHYVYRVGWTVDGSELLFTRTNRRQNILELAAADPASGLTRVILREQWPTGWVKPNPALTFLADGRRFIWESERNGWSNLYLYDLTGRLITPLTSHDRFEVGTLVKIDEGAGVIFYTARDGDNYMKMQLHRVGLDGRNGVRLTDPAFHHSVGGCMVPPARGGPIAPQNASEGDAGCGISPDNAHFVDVYQTHALPPASRLVDAQGQVVADLAKSDLTTYSQLGFRPAEMFSYTAADRQTTLHGLVQFPSGFDPSRKYPALVNVYGGPGSGSSTARETFVPPNATAEHGFLILNLDTRSSSGQGKRLLDDVYLKLGQVEIDDLAEGVKALWTRPYLDKARVGIHGTSYGGYAAVMSLLRHPGVFAAASASSPVTAWHHYDSIYTERYMWIPQENKENYEKGSAMTYAKGLRGRLLLYYGTADNNVHPSNMMQLIQALQEAGKSFDVQVGPDRGHGGINQDRMMEFFIENLIMRPVAATSG